MSDENFCDLASRIFEILDKYEKHTNELYYWDEFKNRISRRDIVKDWFQKNSAKQDNIDKLNSLFKEEYGYNFKYLYINEKGTKLGTIIVAPSDIID